MRPGTDDRHVSPDNVPQLGQFIDAGAPQQATDRGNTIVVARYLLDLCTVFDSMESSKL